MEDYSVGSALADEFDVTNELNYSSSGELLLRSSNSTVTRPFYADLSPEADHVVAVQMDRASDTLGAEKDVIAGLFQDWGLSAISVGFIRHCWYHVPVVQYDKEKDEGFNHSLLHVWHVLDTKTSHIKLLVFYPLFMAAHVKAILPSLFSDSLGLGNYQWPQIHLALIRAAIDSWEKAWLPVVTTVIIGLRSTVLAIDKTLETGSIKLCDEGLKLLNQITEGIVLLEKITTALCQYFERDLPDLPGLPVHPAILLLKNLQNMIDWLLGSSGSLREKMILRRQTLSTSIEIKNASYVRANTIALRRIAEQNQTDARQLKLQAELAQKSSQSMTRIAYMTMLYLPANFIATCFSMTFLASAAWNRLYIGLEKKSTMITSEESVPSNDIKILEPQSHSEPSVDELYKRTLAAFSKGDIQVQDGSNPTSLPSTAEPEDFENSGREE